VDIVKVFYLLLMGLVLYIQITAVLYWKHMTVTYGLHDWLWLRGAIAFVILMFLVFRFAKGLIRKPEKIDVGVCCLSVLFLLMTGL
jgi:hypothetical protein